ncbi:MAG: transglutaminase domain-containing protein, partial [Isosphaeraceae bacterium]|nr:transglutaminase domain-containing protein [Isosphaeraceae bacterium]
LEFFPADGTFWRPDPDRSGSFEYEITSAADGGKSQPHESYPFVSSALRSLLKFPEQPEGMKERLRRIAEAEIAKLAPESRNDRTAIARCLESYLRSTGGFTYSLQMGRNDPTLDPVEDFLINRKQGHCEYFASALCLLLRSVDIPARVVNGFKGGDWNTLGRVLYVRQKHAHSWVEALLSEEPEAEPRWLTLDPTPASQREAVVAQIGGLATRLRPVSDYLRYLWVFYIAGYSAERQKMILYDPALRLIAEAQRGFGMMLAGPRALLAWLLDFPDIRSFFSVRGFVVSVVAMLLLVGLYRAVLGLSRFLRRRPGDQDSLGLAAGVAFYHRLLEVLASCGLSRPAAETPREFAHRAALFLAGREMDGEAIAEVPTQVVEAFYHVRFGGQRLDPEALRHLETRLDALEARLRPRAG